MANLNFEVNKAAFTEKCSDCVQNMYAEDDNVHAKYVDYTLYNGRAHLSEAFKKRRVLQEKETWKEVFGTQKCCKNYTHKNWIWTFSRGNVVMIAHLCKTGLKWQYLWDLKPTSSEVLGLQIDVEQYIFDTLEAK